MTDKSAIRPSGRMAPENKVGNIPANPCRITQGIRMESSTAWNGAIHNRSVLIG